MNEQTAREERFWDKIAPSYARKPVRDEAAYEATLERVRYYLRKEQSALELGCGTGTTALKLAPSLAELLAVDLSGEMIRIARSKAANAALSNVSFRQGTLEDVSRPGGFDVVMGFNVFHLLPDFPAQARRVAQLLKPGGLFISKTPCIGEQGLIAHLVIPVLRAFDRAPYVNPVKIAGVKAGVESAGFDIIETGLFPRKSHSLFIVARKRA